MVEKVKPGTSATTALNGVGNISGSGRDNNSRSPCDKSSPNSSRYSRCSVQFISEFRRYSLSFFNVGKNALKKHVSESAQHVSIIIAGGILKINGGAHKETDVHHTFLRPIF